MKLLILGGTRFLGRAIVEAAQKRGHTVTLFHRGQSNPDPFPDVEHVHGNRDGGLDALQGRTWDAVVDTCGFVPRLVSASANALAKAVEHYVFISSISVYADFSKQGMTEDASLATLQDEQTEEITNESYGGLKVLCERAAEQAMPNRVLHIRPGFIVGPHDPTDRFTYWPVRIAHGGEMLAPGEPGQRQQFIDVRDLAAWIVHLVEQRKTGPYNATGPDYPLTMEQFLDACKEVTGSNAQFVWVSGNFLLQKEAIPPLWFPKEEEGGAAVDCSKAIRDGLTFRPLKETIADTLAWKGNSELRAGFQPEQEKALLQEWLQREDSLSSF